MIKIKDKGLYVGVRHSDFYERNVFEFAINPRNYTKRVGFDGVCKKFTICEWLKQLGPRLKAGEFKKIPSIRLGKIQVDK